MNCMLFSPLIDFLPLGLKIAITNNNNRKLKGRNTFVQG